MRGRTEVVIDLGAIAHNFRQIRSRIGPAVRIMVVVKADGYGHGAVRVSQTVVKEGADALAVTTVAEGIELRKAGLKIPILILGPLFSGEIESVINYYLTPTLLDFKIAELLSQWARKRGRVVSIHINVDTGMGRLGIHYEKADQFALAVSQLANLQIEGIYSHFSSAEFDADFTLQQIRRFKSVFLSLKKKGIDPPLKHISNSAALLGIPEAYFNMVRPGLVIYGYCPGCSWADEIKFRPSMGCRSRIVLLKTVPAGASLSYGRTYVTFSQTRIAIIPVGYADGYPLSLSNRGWVLIRGKKAAVVGKICMDQTIIDVTHIEDVQVEDEVILWGSQGEKSIRLEELSLKAKTIPYEFLTVIGGKLPRVYRE